MFSLWQYGVPVLAEWFVWEINLGEAVVGAGTIGLAAATVWLAKTTKSDVELSTKNIELTQQSIEAQEMPFVIMVVNPTQPAAFVDEPGWMLWTQDEAGRPGVHVRLWNIGRGPAIVRDVRMTVGDDDLLYARQTGEIPIGVSGEAVHDTILPMYAGRPTGETNARLRIYYAHTSGTEYMTGGSIRVGDYGLRPTGFERRESDGEGRQVSA